MVIARRCDRKHPILLNSSSWTLVTSQMGGIGVLGRIISGLNGFRIWMGTLKSRPIGGGRLRKETIGGRVRGGAGSCRLALR
jgi:hypothetical protein